VEAADCYELLSEFPTASLKDAALHYLSTLRERSKSITFFELFNRYLEFKQNRTAKYLNELRITRDRFKSLHEARVCDITPGILEPLLLPIPTANRNAIMRYLRAVFTYGVKRSYLTANPIARLDFTDIARKEVEILEPEQVRKLLEDALANDLELLPFLVLGFFSGIRPDGELTKLEWRDIDLSDRAVTIRSEVSKTRRRRFPTLSDNAVTWLNEYHVRGGRRTGRVVQWGLPLLRSRRLANRARAGVSTWPQQGMRHTFCSYWLAIHKDINQLVLLSGHANVDTMWRHYHRGATETEARAFWNILPPAAAGNILPFANQAAG
jgi:integrase